MHTGIHSALTERKASGRKSFAILVDPDKVDAPGVEALCAMPRTPGPTTSWWGAAWW